VSPAGNSTLSVAVDVTNIGGCDGDEVVQLYAVPSVESQPPLHRAGVEQFERMVIESDDQVLSPGRVRINRV